MRRAFVGFAAGLVGSVPVGRALDIKKSAPGKVFLPDPEGDPTLIKGTDTDFTSKQFMPGGLLVLPSVNNTAANTEIKEIVSATELRLKKPFKGDVALKQLTGQPLEGNGHLTNGNSDKKFVGIKFSVAPHVDQSAVYDSVFKHIKEGHCIGIFPEGGSHDRTELLPLKAGLAIMALGALAQDPDCGVTIVPVGMNYFHAHKFRSRCVVEFGSPISIDPELVQQYKDGNRREATGAVLNDVQDALKSVTIQAPDYDTLMLIQAVRRLYNPKGKRLPLPMIVELNRRLLKGYETYKDDPRIIDLKRDVLSYNRELMQLNIRDHQVSYAKFPWWKVVAYLVYRLGKLAVLSIAVIPGALLFAPVFIIGKLISIRKAREALAASTVKIAARDVMATWKILVSMALAPALDIVYTIVGTYWAYTSRCWGYLPNFVPTDGVPVTVFVIFLLILFPSACFAALRFGEIAMDIVKSTRPLTLSLNPTSGNTLVKLRQKRERLQQNITDIVSELGPELFPDFEHQRIITDPAHPLSPTHSRPGTPRPGTPKHRRDASGNEIFSDSQDQITPPPAPSLTRLRTTEGLPRNDSMQNLGSMGIFSSRPGTPTRSRSRSSSDGLKFKGFSPLTAVKPNRDSVTSPKNLEDLSKSLHAAMRERGKRRQSEGADDYDFDKSEGASTPGEESFDVPEPKKVR